MILQAPHAAHGAPAGSAAHDWMWWIPFLPLVAAAVCGILHFLTLRQREAAHPGPKDDHRAHGGHGHHEAGHEEHAHTHAEHAAHGHDDHGDHAKVAPGI